MEQDHKKMEITIELYDSEYDEETESGELTLKCTYEVCERCEGKGKYVNPAIDGHGISPQEFADDPEFEEAYFSGRYDIPCEKCKGLRVVLVPDPDKNSKEDMKKYHDHMESAAYYARERAAERRMGY